MTPKEQEIAIGELEERVDRLRNIYEQYFLGFEKLEPTVPRKDVDRRFAILRKEQIRNTALRFRFQVVTQKFNTYAMHWVRICRQIEDGTFKRHVRKAKARFGDGARSREEADVSIDIDMDDFEDVDMDSALAEANAAVASYENQAGDTVPPPATNNRARERVVPRQMVLTTPGTSFAVTGRRESLDDVEPNTPMPASVRSAFGAEPRTGRGAALPEGAKPRLLRKREGSEPPASGRGVAAAPQSSPRLPAPSSPGFDAGRPAGPRIQRAAVPAPGSAPDRAPERAPAASAGPAPSAGRMAASAPSIGRVAVPGGPLAPGASSAGRIPAAGAPSAGRMAAPPPSQPDPPAARPAPSAGRFPASPAMRPPPGVPGGGGAASAGSMKAVPPPASVPRLPPTTRPRPGMGPGGAGGGAGAPGGANARPPAPSTSDNSDTIPPSAESRPSVRPRAPLPLPSQLNRPTKKE